jgi:hypothetical protein
MRYSSRGGRGRGGITSAMARSRMPKAPRSRGITRGMCLSRSQGLTGKAQREAVGRRLARSGARIGKGIVVLPPGSNVDHYADIMRGAGFSIRKEDLRRAQGGR